MKKTVYLDNSSTTKPCETAIENANYALCECWGNPSSLHLLGMNAENLVSQTREKTASLINSRADEIYFTGCGTESNNTALLGAARARAKRGNRVVISSVEHPSVIETAKRLKAEGFEVIQINPDKSGKISEKEIKETINQNTILVSIMLANNETGAIMPVKAAAEQIKAANAPALLHCDAVQAFGKMPIDVSKLGVDLMSASGHKIHAPKGIGILYVKKGVNIHPLMTGGGQERGLRSGTEAVPLIYALKGALDELPDLNRQLEIQKELFCYAKTKITENELALINSPDDALPYILNISVLSYRSETLLHFLESFGVYVSSGSACAKGEGSYVLKNMGLDKKRIDSSLRISFSRFNDKEDIDIFCDVLKKAKEKIRKAN